VNSKGEKIEVVFTHQGRFRTEPETLILNLLASRVKVRRDTTLAKACNTVAKAWNVDPLALRWSHDGDRVRPDTDTYWKIGVEEDDHIEAFLDMIGGRTILPPS